jgi:zinc transport system substrate-binding protein
MSTSHEHEDESDEHEHEHEDEGDEHEHENMDPHIWMSPRNAMTMVNNICDGLIQIDPSSRDYYESNRDAYLDQLSEIDDNIESGLAGIINRTFMVYHPAFGYLAHEYDLTMLAAEEEGKEPTAAGLAHLIDQAKEHNIKVIFVEPQFDPTKAETIADEIGGTVVMIDPLAEDYADNLITIKEALIQAME